MSRKYLSIPFLLLITSFMFVMILLFYGSSQLLAFFKTGADQMRVEVLANDDVDQFYKPKVNSFDIGINEGRKMEEATYSKINKDYLASNYYQAKAIQSGKTEGLKDYFTKNTRLHINKLITAYDNQPLTLLSTTIEHFNKIHFYSEDGTIVSMKDETISYQEWRDANQDPIVTNYDTSSYDVMLLLEDNFWRVRHKVKTGNTLTLKTTLDSLDKPKAWIQESQIILSDSVFRIKGINYYPQKFPWQKMWEHFDEIDFASDFEIIKSLGFNTIRIFVPYDYFGKANVADQELQKLIQIMDLAKNHDLKVIVTLFDFFLEYDVANWTLADRHAEIVVNTLKDHPALLAWDIKNEPDLDFENLGQSVVNQWLDFMIKRVKGYDPNGLITIGWSQPEQMHHLNEQLDFLSFHFYRDPTELSAFLEDNKFDKPLFLGETGKHTFSKWWFPFSKSQEDQHDYYQQIMDIGQQYQLHYAIWTLYDFKNVPDNVAGKYPWQVNPQKAYGLITRHHKLKKSYSLIKQLNQQP